MGMGRFLRKSVISFCKVVPFTSEYFGPPTGIIKTAAELAERSRRVGYTLLREPRTIVHNPPTNLTDGVNSNFLEKRHVVTPPVFLASIPSARVWGGRGKVAVITLDDKVIGDISNVGDSGIPFGHPVFQKNNLGEVRSLKGLGLMLASRHGSNYYHWMMDVIPKVKITNAEFEVENFDYVISNKIHSKFQEESLKKLGISLDKVIEIGGGEQVKCERLICPSNPIGKNGTPTEWVIKYLRDTFGSKRKNRTEERKIYVSREGYNRSVNNVDKLIKKIGNVKYEHYKPNMYCIDDQVKAFENARCVTGMHGAGLTNLVFSDPQTSVLEFFPNKNVRTCFYEIADILSLDYKYYCLIEGKYDYYSEEIEIREGDLDNIYMNENSCQNVSR